MISSQIGYGWNDGKGINLQEGTAEVLPSGATYGCASSVAVKGGPFKNLHDFVERVDSGTANRRVVEALIKSGAFDSTGYTRRQLMYFIEETPLLEAASKRQKDRVRRGVPDPEKHV